MTIDTRAGLTSKTQTILADNVVQDITPEDIRNVTTDIIENCHPQMLINSQSDDYTAVLTDANLTYIRMTKATATVFTIPTNASVDFPVGTKLMVAQAGAGQLTITPDTGVTLITPLDRNGLLRGQGCSVVLVKVATDTWEVLAGSNDLQNPNGETLLMD
jgi:hypothetical protein